MRGVIRLGDPTSHGGQVVQTGARSVVMGRAVAVVGDLCVCPRKGHRQCVIIEGDPDILLDGKPVAFDGHHTSCGATLISTAGCSGRSD